MHIRNAKALPGVGSDHGEVVYELFGAAAGGSQQHSLAQIVIPPGNASLKHYHPVVEESYYILSGTAYMEIDGETTTLGPGDSLVLLPGQVHQIANHGQADVVLLAVCVPAWTPECSVTVE